MIYVLKLRKIRITNKSTNKKALKPRLFLIYFYAPCMDLERIFILRVIKNIEI